MTSPKLAVASSGYSGRGYRQIFGDGSVVPSVTTALGIVGDPEGLIHWHVEQTALHAVTHIDDLLSRTEEAGVRYLQYFSRRKQDWDDPERNVFNAAGGVLHDLQDTGTLIHAYIDDDLSGRWPAEPEREDHAEMAQAFQDWKADHDVEILATEATVFGDGYAGTGDIWAVVDGVPMLIDAKSSRKVGFSHIGQLAALGACDTMAVEVPEGTEGAIYHKLTPKVAESHGGQVDSWWVPRATPDIQAYGVLQVRPSDFDVSTGEYIEPFCKLHVIPNEQIDAGWDYFQAGLTARRAERKLKELRKEK